MEPITSRLAATIQHTSVRADAKTGQICIFGSHPLWVEGANLAVVVKYVGGYLQEFLLSGKEGEEEFCDGLV